MEETVISKVVLLLAISVGLTLSGHPVFAKSGDGPNEVKASGTSAAIRRAAPSCAVLQDAVIRLMVRARFLQPQEPRAAAIPSTGDRAIPHFTRNRNLCSVIVY